MSNQIKSLSLAIEAIKQAVKSGKSALHFKHPSGKWYTLSITKLDTYELFVSRTFGGKSARRPGQLNQVEEPKAITDIIRDRFNHGYYLNHTSFDQLTLVA